MPYQGPTLTGAPYVPDINWFKMELDSEGPPGPAFALEPIHPTLMDMALIAEDRRPRDCSLCRDRIWSQPPLCKLRPPPFLPASLMTSAHALDISSYAVS